MGISPQTGKQPLPGVRRGRLRWLRYLTWTVVGVLLVAVAGSYGYARRSLPQIKGQLQLAGLSAPVTVYRDDWGVPHIEASTMHDLLMAQGFVTAQDRLWEMDLTRRAASGRLSEVLGASQVGTDKFFRALQLRRSAERSIDAYAPWAREALDAYVQGVNAFIDQATSARRLPVEFTLLGYKPEPWTAVDSLTIGKFMAYDLGGNWPAEVYRYQLRQKVGDTLAKQLLPTYPADGITIMKYTAEGESARQAAELPPAGPAVDVSGLLATAVVPDEFVGSNNWVVGGTMTRSGKPLLANDPHLGIRTPAIWYQTHLVLNSDTEKMNVIGVIFPGSPGIVIGHNDKVAWGVTNTGPDVQDLFIEKRNPANPHQFEFKGQWEDAKVYDESIKVKGQPDVPFEVVVTRHGPIISEIAGSSANRPQEALALKWTAHLPTTELQGLLQFDKASNWTEFREGLKDFEVPTQNFVFAAVDGTIAYHAGGIVPVRAKGDGLVPVPGWTGEYEWTSYIPFDKMPEVVNPAAGFIVSANNKVVDDGYPYFISSSWAQPYRATRIAEDLKGRTGLTVDDMRQIQTDFTNLQARTLVPVLTPLLDKASLNETEKGALALLKGWNMVDAADAGAPLVFQFWWKHLTQRLYEPVMGADLYGQMADQGNVTDTLLTQAAAGNVSDWVKKAGGLDTLAVTSFKEAVAEVAKLQGSNVQKWAWGKFHRFGPQHTLGAAVKPLGWFLNTKEYPIGGSNVTVGAMSFNRQTGLVSSAAPWRQAVDLANPAGNSFDVVTPGQSGHFLSKWYDSQEPLHANGQLHPQQLSPSAYQKGSKLTLVP